MLRRAWTLLSAVAIIGAAGAGSGAEDAARKLDKQGTPPIKSAGPLAFGPDGVLFVGDTKSASVVAIDTGDRDTKDPGEFAVEKIDAKIASMLGTSAGQILINDMAVNPASGMVYLSVSRGRGPSASPVLVRVGPKGTVSEVSLDEVKYSVAMLPNAPAPDAKDRRNQPLRAESITDLAYLDGKLFVAGLSNEEFASNLRVIPFPFKKTDEGTSIEIFHGAHGKLETHSPVRTFTHYLVKDRPFLVAAYTCTPLVTIPVEELKPGAKVHGKTVAELGNRNRPLDMFVYSKDGQDYILMANSARGVMKISVESIDSTKPIAERISGVAGLKYETIAKLKGVEQLDRLGKDRALVLVKGDGAMKLQSIQLP